MRKINFAVISLLLVAVMLLSGCKEKINTTVSEVKTGAFAYSLSDGWVASQTDDEKKDTYTKGESTSILISTLSLSSASLDGAVVEAKNSMILNLNQVEFIGQTQKTQIDKYEARIVDLVVKTENLNLKCRNYYTKVDGVYYLFQYSSRTEDFDLLLPEWENFLNTLHYNK